MTESNFLWVSRPRNYLQEREKFTLDKTVTRTHPLVVSSKGLLSPSTSDHYPTSVVNGVYANKNHPSSTKATNPNPKRVAMQTMGAFVDPLSMLANDENGRVFHGEPKGSKHLSKEELLGPWAAKKETILSRFTTTEKLTLTSSYLSGEDRVVTVVSTNQVAGRIQTRLEQLDSFEAGSMKEVNNLSQQDYISRIDQLHHKLQTAWRGDQRVTALKMAIQLAKLLSDTSPLQFYPSKFVLVTDVLETFGQLIFDRISEKSTGSGDKHSVENTSETAKETCRNWFFKVASIRELLPRLYVEMSIMRCYVFLEPKSFYSEIVPRFAKMIRGVGDHLVASYARCYLARMIMQLVPETISQYFILIEDFTVTARQLYSSFMEHKLGDRKVSISSYLLLHQPALEWITDCYGRHTGVSGLEKLLGIAESSEFSGLVLNCVMTSFKAELVAQNPLKICELILKNKDQHFPSYILCRTFGLCLLGADTDPKIRRKIMKEIWPIIVEENDTRNYISAAEIWCEFAAKFFTTREVNRILGDIIEHLIPDRAYERCSSNILLIFQRITLHLKSFNLLLSMDKFMPFLAMLQKEEDRLEAAKLLLDFFLKFEKDSTSDPVVINGFMFGAKIIHEGISSLSSEDEKRSAASLINDCIVRVDYGKDFEGQLNFYADCRAAFSNLDDVAEFLVRRVNNLAMSAHAIQKGLHTRKTASFVRACVAFSFITIPSLYYVPSQLSLYLETTQVALLNQCLGQSDALIKAAIQLFNANKDSLDQFAGKTRSSTRIAAEFGSDLLSLMVIMPDPPELGILYLVRGILNTLDGCPVDIKTTLQTQFLAYISAVRQEDYIYHIDGIDSNDRLYGPDPEFLSEIDSMASICFASLINTFLELKKSSQAVHATKLAYDIVEVIFSHGDPLQMVDAIKLVTSYLKSGKAGFPERLNNLRNVIERRKGDPSSTEILRLL